LAMAMDPKPLIKDGSRRRGDVDGTADFADGL